MTNLERVEAAQTQLREMGLLGENQVAYNENYAGRGDIEEFMGHVANKLEAMIAENQGT